MGIQICKTTKIYLYINIDKSRKVSIPLKWGTTFGMLCTVLRHQWVFSLKKKKQMYLHLILCSIGREKKEPQSYFRYTAKGKKAKDTNYSKGISHQTQRKYSSLWGWLSTGTDSPKKLWNLHTWVVAELAYTRLWATSFTFEISPAASLGPYLTGGKRGKGSYWHTSSHILEVREERGPCQLYHHGRVIFCCHYHEKFQSHHP